MERKLTLCKGQRVIAIKDAKNGAFKTGDVGTIVGGNAQLFRIRFDKGMDDIYFNVVGAVEALQDFPAEDAIRKEIIELIDRQFGKGIVKYGAPLSENPKNLSVLEMLDYLVEELIDAVHYNRQLKRMIQELDGFAALNDFTEEERKVLKRLIGKVRDDDGARKATDV